jgi:hypothetical protein
VIERRRWPRREVAWGARVVLTDGDVIVAKAIDVSVHGLRLVVDELAAAALRRAGKCRVEVKLEGSEATFFRDAEVRHVDEHGVGLAVAEPLPAALVKTRGATPPTAPVAEAANGNGRPSAARRLLSIASAWYRR